MYVFPPRIRAKAKRLPKEYRELYNRSGIYYSPAFPGMSALRSHFEANNATIKLLDPRESEARESE
jgi:hypothetical protein